jgi:hypothetical protein
MLNWHSWAPATWITSTTGPDTDGQLRVAESDVDPVRVQSPGPRRGTTAVAKPGERVPPSAPVATLTPSPLEAIAPEDAGALVVDAALVVGRARTIVDVVLVAGARVVEEGGVVGTSVELVDGGVECEVTEKRRTSRSNGLDHASTWAPGREWGLLAIRIRR